MTFYDWFIVLVAIPSVVVGFGSLLASCALVIADIVTGRR